MHALPLLLLLMERPPQHRCCCPVRARLSTLCSLTFSSALSEPGTIAWALLPADQLPPELPAPQQLLASGGSNVTDAFPAGAVTASDALTLNDTAAINTTISGLASQARFVLLLAARDAAPTPNLLPSLRSLALTSPDITPPVFTSERAVRGSCMHACCMHA